MLQYENVPPDRGQIAPQHDAPGAAVPGSTVPPAMNDFAAALQRRQLTTTILLLLASHRPLTFFTGQLLYALAPLGALAGFEDVDAWAALLSAPDANEQLITMLATSPQP